MNPIIDNRIGAHLSIKGSLLNIFKEADDLSIKVIGCFTGSNLQYNLRESFDQEIIDSFKKKLQENNYSVYAHAPYLINLANKDNIENHKKSCHSIKAELIRCSLLGITGAVVHPGSYLERTKGILTIAESINTLLKNYQGSTQLLLESSAGQGNTVPSSLEEIKLLLSLLNEKSLEKIGLVIDTCHMHAAGYNLSTDQSVTVFLKKYDDIIGLEKVALIHLNDSKAISGSHLDRHENIGKGTIGRDGIKAFLNHPKIKNVPKILETPYNTHLDLKSDLNMIKNLLID